MINEIEKLVKKGFHVFPLICDGKKPVLFSFTEQSTTDMKEVKRLWEDPVMQVIQPYNIGIATSTFENNSALLVVDVDVKKKGYDTLNSLELNGQVFPPTWSQRTPSGGLHLIYKVKAPVSQGTDVLGDGIDIRSRGGYIVGAGSSIGGKSYTFDNGVPLANAPEWIIEKCNEKVVDRRVKKTNKNIKTNSKAAIKRVTEYLRRAKPAIEGQGGDERTFKVCSRVKDLGVDEEVALTLLVEEWNPKCQPPWSVEALRDKVSNTFAYGQNEPGSDAPEAEFDSVGADSVEADAFEKAKDPTEDPETLSPVLKLNKEFAMVIIGGRTTMFKTLKDGEVIQMNVSTFHDLLKPETLYVEKRWRQLSDIWMESHNRNCYDRMAFLPEQDTPEGVYNLWAGFSCTPLKDDGSETASDEMLKGVEMFKEHMLLNVCNGDKDLNYWLTGYFAYMIQKPWKKPSTALVFKGKKGVGKNALIDRIGNMFKPNYMVVSNKRYLISNFNAHLAKLLLLVLDEAFWSGDKAAEGILKDLVTGNYHQIEQKGKESYKSKNLTRVCIIGNEDWIVPSSVDERRFAVFNVGEGRKEDTKYFREMRQCLEKHGGNRLLMRELMAFDLSTVNLNKAPATEGLLEQKIESLSPIHAWWFQSLEDGQLVEMDFNQSGWHLEVSRKRVREAFQNYTRQRGIRSWLPSAFSKQLKKACPGLKDRRTGVKENRQWVYNIPSLQTCREHFEAFMRHKIDWIEIDSAIEIEEAELFS